MQPSIRHPQMRRMVSVYRSFVAVATVVVACLLLPIAAEDLSAQLADTNQYVNTQPLTDVAWALRPIWGLDPDEFHFGGYLGTRSSTGEIDSAWDFAAALGISILELRSNLFETLDIDTLLAQARPRTENGWDQRVIYATNPLHSIGHAREIIVYPFDSVQSYYWQCRFLKSAFPGTTMYNPSSDVRDFKGGEVLEQIYDTSTTAAGTIVADSLVWGYDATRHTHRWPCALSCKDSVQNINSFFDRNDLDISVHQASMFIVVTGHLFDVQHGGKGESVDPDSVLFEIDVVNEIPAGSTYRSNTNQVTTATQDFDTLYKRYSIRKSDLAPEGPGPSYNYDLYRTKIIEVDMKGIDSAGLGGPWSDTNSSKRFDIRVRWMGHEKVALRSITFRDLMAQRILGTDAAATAFRTTVDSVITRIVVGPNHLSTDTSVTGPAIRSRLRKLVGLYSGDEGLSTRNMGFNWLDSILYRRYGMFDKDSVVGDTVFHFWGDSATRGIRAFRAQSGSDASTMTSQQELIVEAHYYGYGLPKDGKGFKEDSALRRASNLSLYGVALSQVPAIAEHDGGRYLIPKLELTRQGVEDYTNLLQRSSFGSYIPGPANWPYVLGDCNNLGHSAFISRRTGRRIVLYANDMVRRDIRWLPDSTQSGSPIVPVTLFGHIPEESELLATLNLGLCYSARGVHWSFLGNPLNEFDTTGIPIGGGEYRSNYGADWGPIGPSYSDSTADVMTPLVLQTRDTWPHQTTITLDTCYVGWRNRLRTIRWIDNVWVPGLWPRLKRLRWRDGYSMHFQETQLYSDRYTQESWQMRERPLPSNEIVTSIRSYGRDDTLAFTRLDSATQTYVELGLFDKLTGMTLGSPDPYKDTMHLFVVNRRTLDRPGDVAAGSDRGKTLDSLSEWRRVGVTLHLPTPDSLNYVYCRVREVSPDTTRLPFATVARDGLDTLIGLDSTIFLEMRPGGGSLLEITYLRPTEQLDGIMTFNNGRHIVFDGLRYHATYVRYDTDSSYINSTTDTVFYRYSRPLSALNHVIDWDGPEVAISAKLRNADTARLANRTPSITVRRDSVDTATTVVTIVWTAHVTEPSLKVDWRREVVSRNFAVKNGEMLTPGKIQVVDYHLGSLSSGPWGTVAVSSLYRGDCYAWSDSVAGIKARVRALPSQKIGTWWDSTWTWSPASLAVSDTPATNETAQFPTMPSFSLQSRSDSVIPIAWQQGSINSMNIRYNRLVQAPSSSGDTLLRALTTINLTPSPGKFYHPSMDNVQWQDSYWLDAVAWEKVGGSGTQVIVQELHGPCDATYGPSLFDPHITQVVGSLGSNPGNPYPQIALLNEDIQLYGTVDSTHFAIVYEDTAYCEEPPSWHYMMQNRINLVTCDPPSGYPHRYQQDGYFPSISASTERQDLQAAVIYQDLGVIAGRGVTLRTTQQFFGKGRPYGYVARGRELHLRINDSTRTGINVRMHDVWTSDDTLSRSIRWSDRGSIRIPIDSLPQVEDLLRTAYFTAHDSTMIGCELLAEFLGDSSSAPAARLDCIAEVVDSASGDVVGVLDSFTVSADAASHSISVSPTFDLLSGIYYVRLRVVPTEITVPAVTGGSQYPVAEVMSLVDGASVVGKARRLERVSGSQARLSMQPNPSAGVSEIRFSVPNQARAWITVYDNQGRQVRSYLGGSVLEGGRYALEFDGSRLVPGVYLIELRAGKERAVEKMVIAR